VNNLIYLDPGHGGTDPGATYAEVREKEINLTVALTVGQLLTGRGYSVKYSRIADITMSLSERTSDANAAKAACYIAIHCNAAPVGAEAAHGIETWYYKGSSRCARLAKAIQQKAVAVTGAKNRLVRATDAFWVLKHSVMPAALIEMGFLSNEAERRMLTSEPYQRSIAGAIAEGIDSYMRGE